MSCWNRSLRGRVTVPASSRASIMDGTFFQAMIWYVATEIGARCRSAGDGPRSAAAHELGEQGDLVSRPQRRVEGVVDVEHRVVDEDLDVLAQLFAVPESPVQLGKARREPCEHAPDRRTGRQRLVEDAPPRAVAAHELRDPGGDLHGNGRGGGAGGAHQAKIYQTRRSLARGRGGYPAVRRGRG